MRVVCPSCDREPPPGATAGGPCAGCKASLVQVASDDDLVGSVIDGRFELLAVLGAGGMGTVYRATQRSIGRDVALKLMDRRFERDVNAVKRFLREAKLASQLAHPHTVGVIDFGQNADGRLYLAMELVRGKTLHDVLQRGAFAVSRVARIGVQLCDALEAAHALSIVHRDLKLENIMLLDGPADRDHVKVLDFGLARSTIDANSRATATGMISGTPRYLAPEVALYAAEAAPAQDMYALGVILGELASGCALWEAPTFEALIAAKTQPSAVVARLDLGLRVLVERLLATEPAERPLPAETRAALLAIASRDMRPASSGAEGRRGEIEKPKSAPSPEPTIAAPVGLEPTRELSLASSNVEVVEPPKPLALEPLAPPPLPKVAFAPPKAPDEPLELETEWQREKAAKRAAASARPRSSSGAGAFVIVGVLALAVGGVWYITRPRGSAPPPSSPVPATRNTVQIRVRAPLSARIRADGVDVGPAPAVLNVPRARRPLAIEATVGDRVIAKDVVPDRDQDVELGP